MVLVLLSTFSTFLLLCTAERPVFLEVKHGDSITLPSPISSLYGDYNILWSLNNNETLINLSNGTSWQKPPVGYINRLSVNLTTGSLLLFNLSSSDTGIYTGEIINGDYSVHSVLYNVSVLKSARVINSNPSPPPVSAARHHWTAGVCAIICLCVCVGLIFKAHVEKEKNKQTEEEATTSMGQY